MPRSPFCFCFLFRSFARARAPCVFVRARCVTGANPPHIYPSLDIHWRISIGHWTYTGSIRRLSISHWTYTGRPMHIHPQANAFPQLTRITHVPWIRRCMAASRPSHT